MSKTVPHKKPKRYIVTHQHYFDGQSEQVWVSYNTELDKILATSTYSQANSTAFRYFGDLLADYENGEPPTLIKSYRK